MGEIEAFFAACVAGIALLLAAVAALASRRQDARKMMTLAAAFAAAGLGGLVSLLGELSVAGLKPIAPTIFAGAMAACMILLYGALFARRATA